MWRWLKAGEWKRFLRENLLETGESPRQVAGAEGLGITMSIMPVWSMQTVAAIGLAHALKLNKVVAAAFANVSIPPLMPFIIYGSVATGTAITGHSVDMDMSAGLSWSSVKSGFWTYMIGGAALAIVAGAVSFAMTWITILLIKRT